MSQAKLNIWLRFADCSLIRHCWRTDLAIITCCGESLVDMDPTILEQLKDRYPNWQVSLNQNYHGADRILLQAGTPSAGPYLQHIEVDVPPGCYVVWTRICYHGNEETNKVMVIVRCGDHACVNLLLNKVRTCAEDIHHPLLEEAVELDLPGRDLRGAARVMNAVLDKNKKQVMAEIDQRLEDVGDDKKLRGRILKVKEVLKRKGGCAKD